MRWHLGALALLLAPVLVKADDTVTVDNGDTLNGKIVRVQGGKLFLETSYAGTVGIAWDKIVHIASEGRFEIEAETGRLYRGSIERDGPRLEIAEEDTSRPMRSQDVVRLLRMEEDQETPGFWKTLRGGLGIGYSLTRGNSSQTQSSLSADGGYRREKFALRGDLSSIFSTIEGGDTTERHALNARYDRFLSPRSFAFALTGLERNERQNLALRSRFGGGFGWKVVNSRATKFDLLGGFTYTGEQFEALEGAPSVNRSTGEGLFGFEAETSKLPGVRLTTRLTAHPNLVQSGRFRIEYDAAAHVPVIAGFAWKISLFDRYDSNPPSEGVLKNDYGIISTFGVSF